MDFSKVELPSNRKFGFFFSVIFLIAGVYVSYEVITLGTYIFAILTALFFVITLFKPSFFLSFNKLWMRFGFLLGVIVSPIILGAIFFLLFTPTAFLMRRFGRDELRLRFKSKDSYWIKRDTSLESGSFENQF